MPATDSPPPLNNLRSALFRGTLWTTAMRWSIRALGLASTAILARLLEPTDFGIVAMAMLVVGFMDIWMGMGLDTALIQNRQATRDDYDSAWTLRLAQALAIGLVIAGAAPAAATYFDEPRVTSVLWVIATAVAVSGLTNIGAVDFQKELRFDKEYRLLVTARLASFFVTIAAAWLLRSYWAMVLGIAANYIAQVGLSYLLHPYRPRFCTKRIGALWRFSKWMLIYNAAYFAERKTDEIIVGRIADTGTLGLYNVASGIADMPGAEIAQPLNRALLPAFAKIQEDHERLRRAYHKVLATVLAVALPACVGLALVAEQVVLVLLGAKWTDAVPLLQVLPLYGAVRLSYASAYNLFLATGRPHVTAALSWAQWIAFIVATAALAPFLGILGVAWAKVAAAVMGAAATFFYAGKVDLTDTRAWVAACWRPVTATAAMATALINTSLWELSSPLASLLAGVGLGVGVYVGVTVVAWRFSGSAAETPEAMALNWFTRLRRGGTTG